MDKEEYGKLCDSYANAIKKALVAIAEELFVEFGITMMVACHIAQICPEIEDARGCSLAMGSEKVLLRMVDILKEDLEKGNLEKDIRKAFKILEGNKKPYLN